MTRCVALLRGINVGHARRIAMADLRNLLEGLGFSQVCTVLNSGNAVFRTAGSRATKVAPAIEAAIQSRFGLSVPVVVVTAPDLDAIVTANPLPQAQHDPAKFLVVFPATAAALNRAKALQVEAWEPEALAVGRKAAYLWCASGVSESSALKALSRVIGDAVTSRNWATVLKLQALAAWNRKVDSDRGAP